MPIPEPEPTAPGKQHDNVLRLYLDTLERVLVGEIYEDLPQDPWSEKRFDPARRSTGRDWPSQAHTMIGSRRLHNLRELTETVLREQVPGDLIETGVWRGGACILMRAVLAAYGVRHRKVFVADSFAGLPQPDPANFPVDAGDIHHTYPELTVSLDQVKSNFERYGLLDEQVVFLKGWFKETLVEAPIDHLAILRLDGDMYESTIQALTSLYPKLSPGGFCIIDDGNVPGCQTAVRDFREQNDVQEEPVNIDDWGFYWRKR